jgi:hypothetical protein
MIDKKSNVGCEYILKSPDEGLITINYFLT